METFDVDHVAWLSRLELTQEEKELFGKQLKQILDHAEVIKSVDTSGISPTYHPIPLKNVMREDVILSSLSQEEALSNAPQREGGAFVVPRIM